MNIEESRRLHQRGSPVGLWMLVTGLRVKKATDRRDKVYGVLSLGYLSQSCYNNDSKTDK